METNKAQADYWASPAGLKWIEHEHALDSAMAGMLRMMLDVAEIGASDRVIDIGCGTGASTLDAARRAPDGTVLGVDISDPLLARAADRVNASGLKNASFLLADAQTYDFSAQPFDLLVSRLGMSFFSDSVAALKNLSNALNKDGKMVFVCWASVEKNPWFAIPKSAAEERLGALPKGNPLAPGPTAFQDCDRVADLMDRAGVSDIEARPVDILLTPPGGVEGAARAASKVGPAARIMKAHNGTKADEAAIENAVMEAFEGFDDAGTARVPAVVNLFTCSR
ncbi:class I SAM-dependent methyltransferase [Primorskyibacter aestuariivivens]|uniref:class I SAM-dependent methyltransferase n=1 Tax=Primorskyibacter aestuariivivens TaxID=1888912 RepID=UPI0022FFF2C3|nr:class I SAM-dependent methyltransferase [Primorskyibacter aestuariivivens]MDA7429338.1 class I SAM-dependent methyltransferase [Primorskyibacter aestuariivivens]